MDKETLLDAITTALANLQDETILKVVEATQKDISTDEIVNALSDGMDIIGERFEASEYFLSELIMAGELFREAQEKIVPYLKTEIKSLGKVVMGTVKGDLHDIGKNIVIALLRASGFEVIDLGINVDTEKFVETVREVEPDILGMSALLRATVPEMKNVIQALEEVNLRHKVTVIVGGLPLNEEYAKKLDADYYAEDAWKGVGIIRKVVANH